MKVVEKIEEKEEVKEIAPRTTEETTSQEKEIDGDLRPYDKLNPLDSDDFCPLKDSP